MPRPALCCRIKLKLRKVTCPGTLHLADRNLVFITVSLLAQTKQTNSVFASFPFDFHESLTFERIFTNASNLDQLLEILEDEIVSIELRQYSEKHQGGKVLANFEAPSRHFLFPAPSFTPKDDVNRELLLTRTPYFSAEKGLNPMLAFSTKTTIEETRIASSSKEHLSLQSKSPRSAKKSPSSRSKYPTHPVSSSSETEEEIIIMTPRKGTGDSIQFQHCVCECCNRPENNGQYIIRSRSVSPGKESRQRYRFGKPPFKVGRAPASLISKRDFGDSPSRFKRSNQEDRSEFPCTDCRVPHPDCSVCAAYKQTYGKGFLQYRFPSEIKRTPPKVSPDIRSRHKTPPKSIMTTPKTKKKTPKSKSKTPQARARIPIISPISSDEDEDRYRAALTVSSGQRKHRSKMFHNPVAESGRHSSTINGNHSYVRGTVKELLKKNDSVLQYELTDSELENSFLSDVSDGEDMTYAWSSSRTRRPVDPPERSIVVPLSSERYWSTNARKYTGKSHREIFNDSLNEIYKSMYSTAIESD